MRQIYVIAHNLRSCHNVGSLIRTAEGLGVTKLFLTGYSPYPIAENDIRMPHLAQKIHKQIQKTALDADSSLCWEYNSDIYEVIQKLHEQDVVVAGLEQDSNSTTLIGWKTPKKLAIVLGRETEGLEKSVIEKCDLILEIPMYGKKESFNVVQAAAMALYHCQFL